MELSKIISGKYNKKDAKKLFYNILQGKSNDIEIAGFLTALSIRKPGIEELTEYLKIIKENSKKIELNNEFLVDICGTGGDNSGTFNISTAVMFVASGAGISIAKHGNRSSSSKCGSADVLEELGININLPIERSKEIIEKIGLGFLFAQIYHPCFKNVSTVRKKLGFKTMFNFLGPLSNPANVKRQIIGVYDPELTEITAEVLRNFGSEHVLAVHGNGLDEFTINGKTKITELKDKKIRTYYLDAKEFHLSGSIKKIKGGLPKLNREIILNVLNGKKGSERNIVVLNSAAAIYVSGKAKSIKEGIIMAQNSIDSKNAFRKLNQLIEESSK